MFRQWIRRVVGLLGGLIVIGCADPQPIALVPLPPGVEYPWRTQTGAPTPAHAAAIRRARLVVESGSRGAVYYADNWQALPAFPPPLPERLVAAPEVISESPRGLSHVQTQDEEEPSAEPVPRGDAAVAPRADEPATSSIGVVRRVNVNSASAEELESLSGIGPSLAARIIEARPFGDIDDLLDVRGIGPRTLARFESSVTVD